MQKLEGTDLHIEDHTDIHIGIHIGTDTVEATLPFMVGMEVAVSLASVFCSAALHVLFVFVYARAHARIFNWAVITLIHRAEATTQRLWLLKRSNTQCMANNLLMDSLEAIHHSIHHSMVSRVCSQECSQECNPCNTTSK